MNLKCPSCNTKNLVKRGTNTLRNIRLRKNKSRYDDFYCEKCNDTFSEDEVNIMFERDFDATEATDW